MAPPLAPPSRLPTSILLIDDSAFTRRLVRGMLRSIGYTRITEAPSGRAALRSLKTHPVDVILLDWRMPQGGGAEVLARVRASDTPRTAVTPVIIMSAHVDIALLQQAAELDASSVIVKPFSVSVLKSHVDAALGQVDAKAAPLLEARRAPAASPAQPEAEPAAHPRATPGEFDDTEIVYL